MDDSKKLEMDLVLFAFSNNKEYNDLISRVNKRVFEIKEDMLAQRAYAMREVVSSLHISGKGYESTKIKFFTRIPIMEDLFPKADISGCSESTKKSFLEFVEMYKVVKEKDKNLDSWALSHGHWEFFQHINRVYKITT